MVVRSCLPWRLGANWWPVVPLNDQLRPFSGGHCVTTGLRVVVSGQAITFCLLGVAGFHQMAVGCHGRQL